MAEKIKAWFAREKNEFCCTIVFAETRGKARALAQMSDACCDADFCNIEIRREPTADCHYKDGKTEMDWNDPKDRLFLVKDLGWHCEDTEFEKCNKCVAKECCDNYNERYNNDR